VNEATVSPGFFFSFFSFLFLFPSPRIDIDRGVGGWVGNVEREKLWDWREYDRQNNHEELINITYPSLINIVVALNPIHQRRLAQDNYTGPCTKANSTSSSAAGATDAALRNSSRSAFTSVGYIDRIKAAS